MPSIICNLLQLYIYVIIAGALLSWFPTEPDSGLAQIRRMIGTVTEPVMAPVRRVIGASFGSIDFSPLVVILGLSLLVGAIC